MAHPFAAFNDLARWVVWREEPRQGDEGGKPTKKPYSVRTGKPTDATDRANWVSRRDAEIYLPVFLKDHPGGLGLPLGDLGDGRYLAGIDLDSCFAQPQRGIPSMITRKMGNALLARGYTVDEIRQMTPGQAYTILNPNAGMESVATWAVAYLDLLQTYSEVSPSGRGLKAYFYIAAKDVRRFLERIGVDADHWGTKRGIKGINGADHGPAVEIYTAARYFAVTEWQWQAGHAEIALIDRRRLEALAALLQTEAPAGASEGTGDGESQPDTSRSADALRAALSAQSPTYEAMVEMLRTHDNPGIRDWVREKGEKAKKRELKRIWKKVEASQSIVLGGSEDQATDPPTRPLPTGIRLDDFVAYGPQNRFLLLDTRELWVAPSINAIFPKQKVISATGKVSEITPARWLLQRRRADQFTWAPGMPAIIEGKVLNEGGWVPAPGKRVFNLYLPPVMPLGDPTQAGPWLKHFDRIYPEDSGHGQRWLAYKLQFPGEKINHALVLGGRQGIGKDSLLAPVKRYLGEWNFREASPDQVMGRFNNFLRGVILRINEMSDTGNATWSKFYNHVKAYITNPPETLRCDEKNLREYAIPNVVGVLYTTNTETEAIFLPADDRRHYIALSSLGKEDFSDSYWREFWGWLNSGGDAHVAAYLMTLDLSGFDAKSPPLHTEAFLDAVSAARPNEELELTDTIEKLGNPWVLTIQKLVEKAEIDFADWLRDRRNSRQIPHRLRACGYVLVRNPDAKDGFWKVQGVRQRIYGRLDRSAAERLAAARSLAGLWSAAT
jgi:hypothetical protein